jgi:hypothetical protein
MALVRSLKRQPSERYEVHGETAGTYKVFRHAGAVYLQNNTFGSQFRRDRTHPSQTIQFGPEALVQLLDILEHEVHAVRSAEEQPRRFGFSASS